MLLVAAICATIIENIPYISLIIGISYLLLSFLDFILKKNAFASESDRTFRTAVALWMLLFVYLSLVTLIYPSLIDIPPINLLWLRSILLFVFVYYGVARNPRLQIKIVVYYIITAIVIACLVLFLHYGVEIDYVPGETRMIVLGTNPNKFAMVYVYTIVFCLFLFQYRNYVKRKLLLLVMILLSVILSLIMIANLASRGALFGVIAIFAYFFLILNKDSKIIFKVITIIVGAIVIVYVNNFMMSFEILASRVEYVEEGDFGSREMLWKIAYETFLDHPLFGVGLNHILEINAIKVGELKYPHNLFLYVLASGGIIGFVIIIGLFLKVSLFVFSKSIKNNNVLPGMLLIAVIMDSMKNGAALTSTINYCFLSLSIAMASDIVLGQNKHNKIET